MDKYEINKLVAENVMGWTNVLFNERGEMYAHVPLFCNNDGGRAYCLKFTDSMTAAWLVVESMRDKGYFFQLHVPTKGCAKVSFTIGKNQSRCKQHGDDIPLLICKAALACKPLRGGSDVI